MAEGFLDITGIDYPETAQKDQGVDIIVHTQNIGDDDDFKVELTGDITASAEFSLGAGLTQDIPFSFTMPDQSITITANTSHLEIPLQIVIFRQSYSVGSSPSYTVGD